ncbi:MAG: hypothetical protein J6C96_00515 [Oscillospiraceae bacterium]|nr:hypothetical protein [Oscillospiraceae bacterium]
MKLVGMKEQAGTFKDKKTDESIDYHNLTLYVTEEMYVRKSSDVGHCGEQIGEYKVKGNMLDEAFGGKYEGAEAYACFIGCEIKLYFDRFRNVTAVEFK